MLVLWSIVLTKAYLNMLIDITSRKPTVRGMGIYSDEGDCMTLYDRGSRWVTLCSAPRNNYHEARENLINFIKLDPMFTWTHPFLQEIF